MWVGVSGRAVGSNRAGDGIRVQLGETSIRRGCMGAVANDRAVNKSTQQQLTTQESEQQDGEFRCRNAAVAGLQPCGHGGGIRSKREGKEGLGEHESAGAKRRCTTASHKVLGTRRTAGWVSMRTMCACACAGAGVAVGISAGVGACGQKRA